MLITDFFDARELAKLRLFVPKTREEYLHHLQTVYNLKLHTEFPLIVHLETTNYCNQKCIMCCHSTMKRKPMMIDPALAKKSIHECAEKPPWFLHFFFFGEPFINEHTIEYMIYAKKIGVPRVSVTTNFTLIKEEEIKQIVDNSIDSIHISFEGLDQESYKRIRKTNHYDTVLKNIEFLLNYKAKQGCDKPWVAITYVQTTERDSELKEFKKKWQQKVNDVHISPQFEYRNGSLNGSRRQEISKYQQGRADGSIMYDDPSYRVPCRQLWARLVVLSNGELVPCSQNIDGELSLGNIKDISMHQAWTGKEMADLRMQHISGNYYGKRGKACKVCTDWDWSGKVDERPEKTK